jgi:3-phosphoshikimate 1-carboxyvinyltransferase
MIVTILPASDVESAPSRKDILLPPDKSILHRVLIIGSLTSSRITIINITSDMIPEDIHSTIRVLRQLGVQIDIGSSSIHLQGVGLRGFKAPTEPLDCGNSGTTVRLMMGVLTAQAFDSQLIGDDSLSKRPMKRLATLLNDSFGANIHCLNADGLPVTIHGEKLHSPMNTISVRSAQIKSAVLLASLYTDSPVKITQEVASRDHTERMLNAFAFFSKDKAVEQEIEYFLPKDFSAVAYFIVAAILSRTEIVLKNVSLNPTRTRFLSILQKCGLSIDILDKQSNFGEEYGDIQIDGSSFRGISQHIFTEEDVSLCIDELPLIAVLASQSEGTTTIRNASELRKKESDRISAICENLKVFGVDVREYEDGFSLTGRTAIDRGVVNTFGDHRIAMAFSLLALVSSKEVTIPDAEVVSISFPAFIEQLSQFIGNSRVQIR